VAMMTSNRTYVVALMLVAGVVCSAYAQTVFCPCLGKHDAGAHYVQAKMDGQGAHVFRIRPAKSSPSRCCHETAKPVKPRVEPQKHCRAQATCPCSRKGCISVTQTAALAFFPNRKNFDLISGGGDGNAVVIANSFASPKPLSGVAFSDFFDAFSSALHVKHCIWRC